MKNTPRPPNRNFLLFPYITRVFYFAIENKPFPTTRRNKGNKKRTVRGKLRNSLAFFSFARYGYCSDEKVHSFDAEKKEEKNKMGLQHINIANLLFPSRLDLTFANCFFTNCIGSSVFLCDRKIMFGAC